VAHERPLAERHVQLLVAWRPRRRCRVGCRALLLLLAARCSVVVAVVVVAAVVVVVVAVVVCVRRLLCVQLPLPRVMCCMLSVLQLPLVLVTAAAAGVRAAARACERRLCDMAGAKDDD
jgi:hypothetical protein